MNRLTQASALLILLASPALARAETLSTGQMKLSYSAESLATAAGRDAIKAKAAAAAIAFCRAHPADLTVADCVESLTRDADRQIEARAQAFAKARPRTELARR